VPGTKTRLTSSPSSYALEITCAPHSLSRSASPSSCGLCSWVQYTTSPLLMSPNTTLVSPAKATSARPDSMWKQRAAAVVPLSFCAFARDSSRSDCVAKKDWVKASSAPNFSWLSEKCRGTNLATRSEMMLPNSPWPSHTTQTIQPLSRRV